MIGTEWKVSQTLWISNYIHKPNEMYINSNKPYKKIITNYNVGKMLTVYFKYTFDSEKTN